MDTCWSCLVIIDKDLKVCPFCGADQTVPEAIGAVEVKDRPPRKLSELQRWVIATLPLVIGVWAILAYVYWGTEAAPPVRPEATAAQSLRQVRTVLSEYAMKAHDSYPPALVVVSGRSAQAMQAAREEGYELTYTPRQSATDGVIRGFTLLARPEKPQLRNYYIDETGVLRFTKENRPATAQDPPL